MTSIGARKVVFGNGVALLINTQERVVLSLSIVGRRYGGVLLWPRDSMRGVVLGDPVKGNEDDSYRCTGHGVDVVYSTRARRNLLHVEL